MYTLNETTGAVVTTTDLGDYTPPTGDIQFTFDICGNTIVFSQVCNEPMK
jgi:hypothetical protein